MLLNQIQLSPSLLKYEQQQLFAIFLILKPHNIVLASRQKPNSTILKLQTFVINRITNQKQQCKVIKWNFWGINDQFLLPTITQLQRSNGQRNILFVKSRDQIQNPLKLLVIELENGSEGKLAEYFKFSEEEYKSSVQVQLLYLASLLKIKFKYDCLKLQEMATFYANKVAAAQNLALVKMVAKWLLFFKRKKNSTIKKCLQLWMIQVYNSQLNRINQQIVSHKYFMVQNNFRILRLTFDAWKRYRQ